MANHGSSTYGNLVRIDPQTGIAPEILHRVPLGASTTDGGLAESDIHDLLFQFPGALPIAAIDASYANAVAVCRELYTRAGKVDALYVNPLGRLTLAEFKLWRNPQARREVIGQILDYAKELASWRYADLQREVSRALGKRGNVLYDLVRNSDPNASEADFVDNVTRHLQRGEVLLLIVGDGIREDVEDIIGFVQRHSGLHFSLALVEAALYRDGSSRIIVQPRVLARTEIVRRIVVGSDSGSDVTDVAEDDVSLSDHAEAPDHGRRSASKASPRQTSVRDREQTLRYWTEVLRDFTFTDVTVETPSVTDHTEIYVKVPNPEFRHDALRFCAYRLKPSEVGCFLSRRMDTPSAVRIYAEVESSEEELREVLGDDLQTWEQGGRPRIGFRTNEYGIPGDDESVEFREAVAWMRDHLDRLVSTLRPRLQRMIAES